MRGRWYLTVVLIHISLISDAEHLFMWLLTIYQRFSLFFWLHWVFIAALGLSLVESRGCAAFSLWWHFGFWSTVCRCGGLSSCGLWAQQLQHMDLIALRRGPPGPGMEPVRPALAAGFSAAMPPGTPPTRDLMSQFQRELRAWVPVCGQRQSFLVSRAPGSLWGARGWLFEPDRNPGQEADVAVSHPQRKSCWTLSLGTLEIPGTPSAPDKGMPTGN